MKILFIFMACFFLINCNKSKKSGNSSNEPPPTVPLLTVSIATDLADITASNAATFTVRGTCSEEGQAVTVIVEGLSPETAPTCTSSGTWSTEIDLSRLTGPSREVSITADHSIDNLTATQATGSTLLHPRVFIATDLTDITASNAATFTVRGTCSEEGQAVTVIVESLSPETAPTCISSGTWSTEIDLSRLTGPSREVSITADHSIDNLTATQATGGALLHPRVSIATDLTDITASNAATFTVRGTCSEEGQAVTVIVEGLSPETAPTCTSNGTWSTEIDLSSLTARGLLITANHSTSNDLAAVQATGSALFLPTVTVSTTLADITATNADDFTVSGTCSEDGQPITVVIGEGEENVSPATVSTCATGAWTTKVDVTGLNQIAEISITASHLSSDSEASAEATGSATNTFRCPANYVGVPSLASYTTNSFCVMKYEAKSDSGDAVSQASGTPYVNISRNDSISKCTGLNGGGEDAYDLITNDEWQTLARNIELVASNWDTGIVGSSGGLSRGHSDSSPSNALAAISDDTKGCEGTGQTCSNTTWDSQRRTHTLSNGEVIWDIAGNAWEWMKDDNGSRYGSNSYFYRVTTTSHSTSNSLSNGTTTTARVAKDQFGPSGDYLSLNASPYGGLGFAYLNYDKGAVLRGGGRNGVAASAFAVHLNYLATISSSSFGFRCVYHP